MKTIWVNGLIILSALQTTARVIPLVGASQTNECLFSATCSIPATEATVVPFTLEENEGTNNFMIVRTFAAASNSPAAGLYVYLFRIFLEDSTGSNCVQRLTIPFGPVVTDFDYNGDGVTGDAVIINNRLNDMVSDLGNFSPTNATLVGHRLTIEFDDLCPGNSSYFLGVVSSSPPATNNLTISAHNGEVVVEGLVPAFDSTLSFTELKTYIAELPLGSIDARKDRVKEQRRRGLLRLVTNAERKAGRRHGSRAALALLRNVGRHTDGARRDWIIDDPATPDNEAADLFELVQQAIASLPGR